MIRSTMKAAEWFDTLKAQTIPESAREQLFDGV
jgi:hypothetical protein